LEITSQVTRELGDPRNELWLSPMSIWELALLVEKKRLELNADMGHWVQQSVSELGLQERSLPQSLTSCDLRCWVIAIGETASWWLQQEFTI
jgi:PIN domain nuclease of toxin-antitoxin system